MHIPVIYRTSGEIPEGSNYFHKLWDECFMDPENIPNGNLFPADGSNCNVMYRTGVYCRAEPPLFTNEYLEEDSLKK